MISYPSLTQVLAIIHQQQGIAVLAHPANNLKGNYALLEEMIAIGIDGIECFSSYHKKAETDFFMNAFYTTWRLPVEAIFMERQNRQISLGSITVRRSRCDRRDCVNFT